MRSGYHEMARLQHAMTRPLGWRACSRVGRASPYPPAWSLRSSPPQRGRLTPFFFGRAGEVSPGFADLWRVGPRRHTLPAPQAGSLIPAPQGPGGFKKKSPPEGSFRKVRPGEDFSGGREGLIYVDRMWTQVRLPLGVELNISTISISYEDSIKAVDACHAHQKNRDHSNAGG